MKHRNIRNASLLGEPDCIPFKVKKNSEIKMYQNMKRYENLVHFMHLNISKYKICEKRATYMSFLTVLISNFHIFIAKLQEQDDVYFECRIVSNPEATKLEWYHEVNFSDKFPSCHIRNYVPLAGAAIVPQCIRRHPPLQSVARYSGNLQVQRLAIIWDGGQNIKPRVTLGQSQVMVVTMARSCRSGD